MSQFVTGKHARARFRRSRGEPVDRFFDTLIKLGLAYESDIWVDVDISGSVQWVVNV